MVECARKVTDSGKHHKGDKVKVTRLNGLKEALDALQDKYHLTRHQAVKHVLDAKREGGSHIGAYGTDQIKWNPTHDNGPLSQFDLYETEAAMWVITEEGYEWCERVCQTHLGQIIAEHFKEDETMTISVNKLNTTSGFTCDACESERANQE
jgi:hypothetical protein